MHFRHSLFFLIIRRITKAYWTKFGSSYVLNLGPNESRSFIGNFKNLRSILIYRAVLATSALIFTAAFRVAVPAKSAGQAPNLAILSSKIPIPGTNGFQGRAPTVSATPFDSKIFQGYSSIEGFGGIIVLQGIKLIHEPIRSSCTGVTMSAVAHKQTLMTSARRTTCTRISLLQISLYAWLSTFMHFPDYETCACQHHFTPD